MRIVIMMMALIDVLISAIVDFCNNSIDLCWQSRDLL